MTYINPISGATVAAASTQQAQLAADKSRQVRHQQAASRNVAATGDRFEPSVENAEAVAAVHDEQHRERQQQQRRRPKPKPEGGEAESRLDVRA